MTAAHVFAPYIVWIFWGLVIGLLAKRKNLNPWGWGIGLIALAFQKFRCKDCGSSIEGRSAEGKLCASCVAEG